MHLLPNQILALAPAYGSLDAIKALAEAPRRNPLTTPAAGRRVAVIELVGYLDLPYSANRRQHILHAAGDPSVGGIVVYCDSPGGEVHGVPELSQAVRYAASKKPVTTIVEGYCCSGALWAVAASTRIVASPSSVIGSVGCTTVMVDDTEAFQGLGIRVIPITSSELKTTHMPGVPPTEAQIEAVRHRVRFIADWFKGDLFRARRFTQSQIARALNGDVFYAAEALDLRLIDELAPLGFESALAEIESQAAPLIASEPYGDLRGKAAIAKFDELFEQETTGPDDWEAAEARLRVRNPRLAAAVAAAES